MTVNTIWTVHLIAVMLTQASGSFGQLVGRWDSEERSRGGLGVSLAFGDAGKCAKTTGVMLDGRWTLSSGSLTRIVPTGQGNSETQVISISVHGNTMVQILDGGRRTLNRVGARTSGPNSMEGRWSYKHDAGGVAYEDYQPDGRFLFRLPITTEACSWEVDGSQLRLTVGAVTTDFTFSVEVNRLELAHDREREVFHRENAALPSPGKF